MQLGLEREISDEEEEHEDEDDVEYEYQTEEIEEIEEKEENENPLSMEDENNGMLSPFGAPNPLTQGHSRLVNGVKR
jgi:hypothetical protein